MEWKQKKCIKISEVKVISQLFEIGSNWNKRKEKLGNLSDSRAAKLYFQLDKRIDNIMEALEGADIVAFPQWWFDKKFKPLSENLKKLKHEKNN